MEEFFESENVGDVLMSSNVKTYNYGYQKEISDTLKEWNVRTKLDGYKNFNTMANPKSRGDAINQVYDNLNKNLTNEEQVNLLRQVEQKANADLINQLHQKINKEKYDMYKKAYQNKEVYDGEFAEYNLVQKYSQEHILDDAKEVVFERNLSRECAIKNSTKDTRKRRDKRQKAYEKHKKAVEEAATAAFKLQNYRKLGDEVLDDDMKKAIFKNFDKSMKAKQEYISALREAEEYDTNNNIKMRRVNNKRVLDLGDGTTKFFQTLSSVRTESKVLAYEHLVHAELTSGFKDMIPDNEKARMEAKTNALLQKEYGLEDQLGSEINRVAEKFPILICQLLGSDDELEALRAHVKEFKKGKGLEKASFVNTIMTDPTIVACIRIDMHMDVTDAEKKASGLILKEKFLAIRDANQAKKQNQANAQNQGNALNQANAQA